MTEQDTRIMWQTTWDEEPRQVETTQYASWRVGVELFETRHEALQAMLATADEVVEQGRRELEHMQKKLVNELCRRDIIIGALQAESGEGRT